MPDKGANLYAFVSLFYSCEQANNPIVITVFAELISPSQQLSFAIDNTSTDEQVNIYRQNFDQNFGQQVLS